MKTTLTMNKLPKYQAYKPSGVEWLGEIPEHWESRKLKHIFIEKKKKTNPDLNCGSMSFGKVITKDDEKIPEATKASYQEVLKGDFLINPLNLNYDLISLRIALSEIDVVVSSGYIVINNQIEINKTYYKWLLHRYDVAYMKLLGSGVRQTINFHHIANSILAFPPIEEQTAIAEFIDRKTALIDYAVGIKEKQIELLKERRQILIHRAVTRGLNPNVKLKDSGVEWIGEIPEHWEVKKAKFIFFKIEQGWSPLCDQYVAEKNEWGVLKVGCVNGFKFNPFENKVLPENLKPRTEYKICKGDILISRANTLELVGSAAIVPNLENKLLLCDKLYRVKINHDNILGEFYIYYLKTKIARIQIELGANGASSSMQNIGQDIIKNMLVIVPPNSEQQEIITHIETITTKIATAICLKEKEIEKLKVYKASLINETVTGKIKVG